MSLIGRRKLLQIGGVTATAALVPASGAPAVWASPDAAGRVPEDVFSVGVASGDPLSDRVVIWTRLAPEPLAPDGSGGMPPRPYQVEWQVATDERFADVARAGSSWARPEDGHSVHVDVAGLAPGHWYYYRFRVQGRISPVGRTRTAPAPGTMPASWTFALASCQAFNAGHYTAYQNMLADAPDLVVHVGDYIYENGRRGRIGRPHRPAKEVRELADYRVRHAQYKTDPDLQAMHRAAPWVVTWDDHEVENNWASEDADPDVSSEVFRRRKAQAFKAYWENMPLRGAQRPTGAQMQLYRRLHWGDLATINVLDTRQYRSDQMADREADSPAAWDPERVMLGRAQMDWLIDGLATSSTRWNVLAQQVPFFEDPDVGRENDKWDGYRVARQRLLDELATGRARNPLVLSGDIHQNRAADLKADFQDPGSAVVGAELAGTSISSGGDTATTTEHDPDPENPHLRFTGTGRGYVRCRVGPDTATADFRIVDTVLAPASSARTVASFVMEDGTPGLRRS